MQTTKRPRLLDLIPPPLTVAIRLGEAMREVDLLRRLRRLADVAESYRAADRRQGTRRESGEEATDGQ